VAETDEGPDAKRILPADLDDDGLLLLAVAHLIFQTTKDRDLIKLGGLMVRRAYGKSHRLDR